MRVLRRREKEGMKVDFVPPAQSEADMDELLRYYGAEKTQASLERTRKILRRFGSINDELVGMRDESR